MIRQRNTADREARSVGGGPAFEQEHKDAVYPFSIEMAHSTAARRMVTHKFNAARTKITAQKSEAHRLEDRQDQIDRGLIQKVNFLIVKIAFLFKIQMFIIKCK